MTTTFSALEPIDSGDFRECASQFPTGVTLVTTRDSQGTWAGLTVNSFSTVSLDPPLVLFCLGNDSSTFESFSDSLGFAIHIAASDQKPVVDRFSKKGADRFADVQVKEGLFGIPVIERALAVFECETYQTHQAGDHLIMVGLVRRLSLGDLSRGALGYFRHNFNVVTG